VDKDLGFFAKHVAQELGVNPNTLRRWAIELEKVGYEFSRNDKGTNGQRIFYQKDIDVLTQFKSLVDQTQSYEDAADIIVSRVKEGVNAPSTHSVNEEKERVEPVKISFTEQELKQYTQSIIEETSAQVSEAVYKRMENLLEQRDQKLLNQLNESMEKRRLEIAAAQEESPSGFWSRLFNRK